MTVRTTGTRSSLNTCRDHTCSDGEGGQKSANHRPAGSDSELCNPLALPACLTMQSRFARRIHALSDAAMLADDASDEHHAAARRNGRSRSHSRSRSGRRRIATRTGGRAGRISRTTGQHLARGRSCQMDGADEVRLQSVGHVSAGERTHMCEKGAHSRGRQS